MTDARILSFKGPLSCSSDEAHEVVLLSTVSKRTRNPLGPRDPESYIMHSHMLLKNDIKDPRLLGIERTTHYASCFTNIV